MSAELILQHESLAPLIARKGELAAQRVNEILTTTTFPDWWEPIHYDQLALAALLHAEEIRLFTGEPTLNAHIVPVALHSGALAKKNRLDPVLTTSLGLLHDALEKVSESAGDFPAFVGMFQHYLGSEFSQQLQYLTVRTPADCPDGERNALETLQWQRQLPLLRPETRLVKLADIYNNLDGKPLSERKRAQRTLQLELLGDCDPETTQVCWEKLRNTPAK